MLDSTVELITQAASNSLFIFCFCNLIIVIILVGSKPGSNFDQESNIPLSMVTGAHANYKDGLNAKHISHEKTPLPVISEGLNAKHISDEKKLLPEIGEVSHAYNASTEENKGNNNNNNIHYDEEEDELRKRVEEFIAKVNKEWKAEILRTSGLI